MHLLGSLATPDLGAAVGGELRLLLGERTLVEAGAKHAHRALAVLKLRLLVLHRYHDPGRLVGDADRRVGRIDRLPPRSGGPVDVDLEVVRIDVHLDLLGLRQHRDGRGRGVDAPLRLRLRHSLHAMDAGLVLEHAVCAVALDLEHDLLEAADLCRVEGERFAREAAPLRVAREHPEEIAREERGLVAAGSRPDLDDHVLRVVRVVLQHRETQLLLELLHPPP